MIANEYVWRQLALADAALLLLLLLLPLLALADALLHAGVDTNSGTTVGDLPTTPTGATRADVTDAAHWPGRRGAHSGGRQHAWGAPDLEESRKIKLCLCGQS